MSLCFLAENESQKHVETSEGEEEKSRDEREVIDMMGKDGGTNQTLNDAEGTETEGASKHREETIEERCWPADFRENEDYDLKNDEQTVDYCPEYASWLIWNVAISVRESLVSGKAT